MIENLPRISPVVMDLVQHVGPGQIARAEAVVALARSVDALVEAQRMVIDNLTAKGARLTFENAVLEVKVKRTK